MKSIAKETSVTEWVKIAECVTAIKYLEKEIEELKIAIKELKSEKSENLRYISNRKLTISLAVISLLSAITVKVIDFLI